MIWFVFSGGLFKSIFAPNMEWLQQHDPFAKDFGYLLRQIIVRTCILLRDSERLDETLETGILFDDFVKLVKVFSSNNKRPDLEVLEDKKYGFYLE